MVRKARVCFDEELTWNATESEEGGVAVQTQTAVLLKLHAGEEPEEGSTELEEEGPTSEEAKKTEPARERRHLAGANWLDDWTLYFPSQAPRKRK
ncbi:MAG: hypothetical protein KDA84_27825, partial [Planctomycetaceae bacterium]|nr:hypothetical protein [Planctomycetaceae bacterium]